jgi:FAD/FMN-containing dehydrogenase
MGGYTLGGGIGPYAGLYGPSSDSVISLEVVTGTGEILQVSETSHADLFWGMRGAGFNYGIVTSFTYQVHDATNGGQAMNADMTFSGSQNGSVWATARSFLGNHPKQLSISFSISYNATIEEVRPRFLRMICLVPKVMAICAEILPYCRSWSRQTSSTPDRYRKDSN